MRRLSLSSVFLSFGWDERSEAPERPAASVLSFLLPYVVSWVDSFVPIGGLDSSRDIGLGLR